MSGLYDVTIPSNDKLPYGTDVNQFNDLNNISDLYSKDYLNNLVDKNISNQTEFNIDDMNNLDLFKYFNKSRVDNDLGVDNTADKMSQYEKGKLGLAGLNLGMSLAGYGDRKKQMEAQYNLLNQQYNFNKDKIKDYKANQQAKYNAGWGGRDYGLAASGTK